MINVNRLKKTFEEMLRINSPSRHEREMADYVKARMTELGFEVTEDDTAPKIGGNAGNVVAFKAGSLPGSECIFLSCHLDTVEPTDKLEFVVDGEEYRTNGQSVLGADDKAGIAAVIEAVESIVESGEPHGDIELLFDVCEEPGLLGARHLDPGSIRGKYGYVFDSQKPVAGITVSAPTHDAMDIEITGRAAHAGMAPETGINAIVAASNAIARMKLGRIDFETTANVGVISGGTARNVVCEKVFIKAEARSRNNEKLDAQVAHMIGLLNEEVEKLGATIDVKHVREYSTFRWTKEDEVVKIASAACARLGIEPSLVDGGGGSDANVFNDAGFPSVVIGVGYDNAHSSQEHMAVDDLVTAAKYAKALIQTASEWRK